jgi:hypothetical protein
MLRAILFPLRDAGPGQSAKAATGGGTTTR